MQITKPRAGDLWGGVAAAAVVVPQAMAFGVALFTNAGFDASYGALAALLGAILVCIVSGGVGGTIGLISAPTGPSLVLLAGALVALQKDGVTGIAMLQNLSALVICTGLLQVTIGISGGGKLIKYIPHPVISGFLTGSAVLMILSQVTPLSGAEFTDRSSIWRWLPLGTALATVLSMRLAARFMQRIPSTIAGLVGGTLVFHLLAVAGPGPVPEAWLIGQLPRLQHVEFVIHGTGLAGLQWHTILPAAVALSILASLDTLLTALIADVSSGARHNANREMIGQGLGQVLLGFVGGMASAGTTGATVVAVKSGGRRWVGVFCAICLLLLVAIAGDIGKLLPISVLAGIILSVSLHMFDRDIVTWLKARRTRPDAVIALLVTGVTVAYDLMIAVGLGVTIAIILFIRTQIRIPVIYRRSTGKQVHSAHSRTPREQDALDEHGDRIVLYELRGNLFFATADSLVDEMAPDLERPTWIILHMRRVLQVDLSAIKILGQLALTLHQHGGTLIFCNVHGEMGVGRRMQTALQESGAAASGIQVPTFNGKDEALEYAESALLDELQIQATRISDEVLLAENELCMHLREVERRELEEFLSEITLDADQVLFKMGDHGDQMYLVSKGEIEVRLPTTSRHYKRLAKCGPGSFFGELALLIPGPRAADAIATHPSNLYVLDRAALDRLRQTHPDTATSLLMNLLEIQVKRLRWSTVELQRLSDW